jgi:hypothetical protein
LGLAGANLTPEEAEISDSWVSEIESGIEAVEADKVSDGVSHDASTEEVSF